MSTERWLRSKIKLYQKNKKLNKTFPLELIILSSVQELQNNIVLSPQFLVNALKSLITAEMFCKKKAGILDKWMEFRQKGILRTSLIGNLYYHYFILCSWETCFTVCNLIYVNVCIHIHF